MLGNIGTASESKIVTAHEIINTNNKETSSLIEPVFVNKVDFPKGEEKNVNKKDDILANSNNNNLIEEENDNKISIQNV